MHDDILFVNYQKNSSTGTPFAQQYFDLTSTERNCSAHMKDRKKYFSTNTQ